MAEDVSIVMSLLDRVSPTLKTIAGNSKAFDKTIRDAGSQSSRHPDCVSAVARERRTRV